MYKIYCDGHPLYDYRIKKYNLPEAKLELELNKTGALSFLINPDNPNYDAIRKMRSIITVYQDDYLLFRGRALNVEEGFYGGRQVTCEGELAFLLDAVIRPYNSKDNPWRGTPKEYLEKILNEYNEQVDEWKRFYVGEVTVADGDTSNTENLITRYDTEYKTAWSLISEKLVGSLGGYLWVRRNGGKNYIDYLDDFNILSNQTVELGKNLLDLKKTTNGEEIATAIIPIGGSGDSKITVAALEDGEVGRIDFEGEEGLIIKQDDYIYCDKAVEKYGWIYQVATYSDIVTDASDLVNRAVKDLKEKAIMSSSIELTAADLAGVKQGTNPFRLGVKIAAKSEPHKLSDLPDFLVKKLSIDILSPSNNKLTINNTVPSYTQESGRKLKEQMQVAERVDRIETDIAGYITEESLKAAIIEVRQENSSIVEQTSTEILTQVAEEYYLKDDADNLIQSFETKFTQTSDEFEFQFNKFEQNISDVASGADARFTEINKYIRFVDGNIVLGEDGNEITLKIQNDRISFLESGVEVAYFSDRKLYVTDGEFLNSLSLGKFAFIPRASGNLSFKKVK